MLWQLFSFINMWLCNSKVASSSLHSFYTELSYAAINSKLEDKFEELKCNFNTKLPEQEEYITAFFKTIHERA